VADQEQAEKEVMEKIKQKMDRIKAAQQKMYADKAKSIRSHKQGIHILDVILSMIIVINDSLIEILYSLSIHSHYIPSYVITLSM